MNTKKVYFYTSIVLVLSGVLLTFIPCTSQTQPQRPVDLVFPQLDSENSRWIFFSSACRPFGMVNLSPDRTGSTLDYQRALALLDQDLGLSPASARPNGNLA